ncbi:MAG TPA: hypothetical protein VK530_16945 [Candidatus Acidoferrum sp.]|nr:hypothetical protein [Candidatus Acidoferrum sp.]
MRNRTPFRQFQIHLTNGEVLSMPYPQQMALPEGEEEMFIVVTKDDWNLIEVARVSRVPNAAKPAR